MKSQYKCETDCEGDELIMEKLMYRITAQPMIIVMILTITFTISDNIIARGNAPP